MLALGAFRIGTLCKLRYRHVRHDLERDIVPVLEARRNGGLPNKILPENINDESPLIGDEHSKIVKPLTPNQIYNILHRLMAQAGLLGSKVGRRYAMRPHSIRKFFRTQMAALGVQTDYIEYMMGHTISTYHDVQMKGVEFLRGIYAASGLSIKAKTKPSRIQILKEITRALGLNPEEILTKEALAKPQRTITAGMKTNQDQNQIDTLLKALKQKLKQEIIAETRQTIRQTRHSKRYKLQHGNGSPGKTIAYA
jgi:hypothetical protein